MESIGHPLEQSKSTCTCRVWGAITRLNFPPKKKKKVDRLRTDRANSKVRYKLSTDNTIFETKVELVARPRPFGNGLFPGSASAKAKNVISSSKNTPATILE
jgi:hypothetical protein